MPLALFEHRPQTAYPADCKVASQGMVVLPACPRLKAPAQAGKNRAGWQDGRVALLRFRRCTSIVIFFSPRFMNLQSRSPEKLVFQNAAGRLYYQPAGFVRLAWGAERTTLELFRPTTSK